MLKTILAIAGKPGLYKLVSRGNKNLIVETVDAQKKRMPAFGADKVVSLGDISNYTDDDKEVPLAQVLENIKTEYAEKVVPLSPKKAAQEEIIAFFEKALPNYDRDRVRVSDMRKVLSWYNLLVEYGITTFAPAQTETPDENKTAETPAAAETKTKSSSKAPVQKNTAKRATAPKTATAKKSTVKKTGNSSK